MTGYSGVTLRPFVNVTEDEDETPTLGSMADHTYWVGRAVNARLPAATAEGNPPVAYTLTGPLPTTTTLTLPAGLSFDVATRRLRGTPQMTAAVAVHADGDGRGRRPGDLDVRGGSESGGHGADVRGADGADQTHTVGTAIPLLTFPAATGGDGGLTYTLTGPAGADPPSTVEDTHGGMPIEAQPATDTDGNPAALTFSVEIVRVEARVTIADATAVEGRRVEFAVTLSRAVAAPLTLAWTAGRSGSARRARITERSRRGS